MASTEDVFGVRAKLVLSYVERPEVDERFVDALKTDHHVVVYGSSKQGKTSLRQKHLPEAECIVVRCNPRMALLDLYQSIVRQSGVRITSVETRSQSTNQGAKVSVGFKAIIPWFGGADANTEGTTAAGSQQSLTTEFVAYNVEDAQAVAELLASVGLKKWIVLENFHYLPVATQQAIAFDLKTFHEIGIRFLILGIWREANLLVTHNMDLQGRLAEVPVEPWDNSDFDKVAAKGATLLNIEIGPGVLSAFRDSAYGNIGLYQEFLRSFCIRSGVAQTAKTALHLDDTSVAAHTLTELCAARRGTLVKALQGIAARSRVRRGEVDQPLLLPYYLVQVIVRLEIDKLQHGLEKAQLLTLLRQIHHREDKETIRVGDVSNLVMKLPTYQEDMTPILYYDGNSRRVRVVDSTVFFVLANVDREELAAEIPTPDYASSEDE
jgi:hypothetical protein